MISVLNLTADIETIKYKEDEEEEGKKKRKNRAADRSSFGISKSVTSV